MKSSFRCSGAESREQWDGHSSIAIQSTGEIRDSDGLVFAKEVWAFCVKSFH